MIASSEPLLRLPDAKLARAHLMLDQARWAAAELARMDRVAIRRIVTAVADAAHANAQRYAEWAVRETGFGVIEHKRLKNEICSRQLVEEYDEVDFVSPTVDSARKMVEIPRPAGVIFAVTPVTNPVATLYFKTLLALMTRNAIVISPHPGAKGCSADAAKMLASAARLAGAPEGAIQAIEEPSIPLVEAVMADQRVDLVVATGGPLVVKAAYRCGNPAYGVGPGNAPVLVDGSGDVALAARRIVESKSFDNSILCTNESTLIAPARIADQLIKALRDAGAYVCSKEEADKLRAYLFANGSFNVSAIGKSATWIAHEAGLGKVEGKILVAPVTLAQPEEPLVREKLCPVLAFMRVSDLSDGLCAARSMMRAGGKGHSAAIHSTDQRAILAYAAALPALRIVVNAGCSQGAAGIDTHLGPSMTIGTGFAGGSSIGENLTPQHFLNFARIAYNKASSEAFPDFSIASTFTSSSSTTSSILGNDRVATEPERTANDDEIRRELRKIIIEELRAALAA